MIFSPKSTDLCLRRIIHYPSELGNISALQHVFSGMALFSKSPKYTAAAFWYPDFAPGRGPWQPGPLQPLRCIIIQRKKADALIYKASTSRSGGIRNATSMPFLCVWRIATGHRARGNYQTKESSENSFPSHRYTVAELSVLSGTYSCQRHYGTNQFTDRPGIHAEAESSDHYHFSGTGRISETLC